MTVITEKQSPNPGGPKPTVMSALLRGWTRHCPNCGRGAMFKGYLTIEDHCSACGQEFEPLRADDAPAYFTIFIVGHIVVAGLLAVEKALHPESWIQTAIWLPVTLILTLGLLPFIKGATMGLIYTSRAKSH